MMRDVIPRFFGVNYGQPRPVDVSEFATKKSPDTKVIRASKKFRRRPTLPLGCPSSTMGAKELNFRVRNGNGCYLFAIAAEKL